MRIILYNEILYYESAVYFLKLNNCALKDFVIEDNLTKHISKSVWSYSDQSGSTGIAVRTIFLLKLVTDKELLC